MLLSVSVSLLLPFQKSLCIIPILELFTMFGVLVFDCSKYHSCCVVAEAENCMPELESGM
jgi:hypothetical protein